MELGISLSHFGIHWKKLCISELMLMGLIHPLYIFHPKIKFVFSFFPSPPLPPSPLREMARKDEEFLIFFPLSIKQTNKQTIKSLQKFIHQNNTTERKIMKNFHHHRTFPQVPWLSILPKATISLTLSLFWLVLELYVNVKFYSTLFNGFWIFYNAYTTLKYSLTEHLLPIFVLWILQGACLSYFHRRVGLRAPSLLPPSGISCLAVPPHPDSETNYHCTQETRIATAVRFYCPPGTGAVLTPAVSAAEGAGLGPPCSRRRGLMTESAACSPTCAAVLPVSVGQLGLLSLGLSCWHLRCGTSEARGLRALSRER